MNPTLLQQFQNFTLSAKAYEGVTPGSDYEPDRPFIGLHIGVAGNVTIRGADGVEATLPLTHGTWSYGGVAIVDSTTTATGITALF